MPDAEPYDPSEHTVDEVLAHVEGLEDLAEIQRIRDAEVAGKRRSTLLEPLSYIADPDDSPDPDADAAEVEEDAAEVEEDAADDAEPATEAAPGTVETNRAGGHVDRHDGRGWVPEDTDVPEGEGAGG